MTSIYKIEMNYFNITQKMKRTNIEEKRIMENKIKY